MDSNAVLRAKPMDDNIVRQVTALLQRDSDEDALDHLQPSMKTLPTIALLSDVYEEKMMLSEMQADVLTGRKTRNHSLLPSHSNEIKFGFATLGFFGLLFYSHYSCFPFRTKNKIGRLLHS